MTTFVFPGQGAQFKGMGERLFKRFASRVAAADAILGYSVEALCLDDPHGRLDQTRYTQPAMYVVNALSYLHRMNGGQRSPEFLAGHSLGEYSALFAAGALDFETGLRLVRARGELMSAAGGGAMVAVVGLDERTVEAVVADGGAPDVDVANYNSPEQLVIAGPLEAVGRASKVLQALGAKCVRLNVSAAFHSRRMRSIREQFARTLAEVAFDEPRIPVIGNVLARPHEPGGMVSALAEQLTGPVRWTDSIRYLLEQGQTEFEEIGPGDVLTRLVASIRAHAAARAPRDGARPAGASSGPATSGTTGTSGTSGTRGNNATCGVNGRVSAEALGSAGFQQLYGIRYAYVAGSMYKGIASEDLVVAMARNGLLGFFGAGGLGLAEIERTIRSIQEKLGDGQPYGMNLLFSLDRPQLEEDTVELYLRLGVRHVEAAGYMEMTPALVRCRLHGLHRDDSGRAVARNTVLAKASRPEVASAFMSPPPPRIVETLLHEGKISRDEALLAGEIPMCDALCAEADSAGHTDQGVTATLVPAFSRMRAEHARQHGYARRVFVGAAGGIGTPEAAGAAFVLGADFVLTGSVNQCTVEARNSEPVKDLLQSMDLQDTDYAPAGDMFELGTKVQVLKKGLLFPARANKLHRLWLQHTSVDDLDRKTRDEIERRYFGRTLDEAYEETRNYYLRHDATQIERADRDPKHRMALIFRWYFVHTMRLALRGDESQRVNFQVHCGPAMGAFNRWVRGTGLESWKERHADVVAECLMHGTADLLSRRFASLHAPAR